MMKIATINNYINTNHITIDYDKFAQVLKQARYTYTIEYKPLMNNLTMDHTWRPWTDDAIKRYVCGSWTIGDPKNTTDHMKEPTDKSGLLDALLSGTEE